MTKVYGSIHDSFAARVARTEIASPELGSASPAFNGNQEIMEQHETESETVMDIPAVVLRQGIHVLRLISTIRWFDGFTFIPEIRTSGDCVIRWAVRIPLIRIILH